MIVALQGRLVPALAIPVDRRSDCNNPRTCALTGSILLQNRPIGSKEEVMIETSAPALSEASGGVSPACQEATSPEKGAPEKGVPERTSPHGLEQFIAGRTLLSGDSLAWSDLFVQIYTRQQNQDAFLVPAVAEPLVVWVMSGEAVVEERDLDGDWSSAHVKVGDFFLTRTDRPYEMRWQSVGPDPFQVMHLYMSVPLFERVACDVLGCAAAPALRDISGGRDPRLTHFLALIHHELVSEGKGS